MANTNDQRAMPVQQQISASEGAEIREVIQALISGQVTGDVHIGDRIYTRSALEELNDYLARAISAFAARLLGTALWRTQAPARPYKFLYPFELEDAALFFGRQTPDDPVAHRA
jgi:hypothetical protein